MTIYRTSSIDKMPKPAIFDIFFGDLPEKVSTATKTEQGDAFMQIVSDLTPKCQNIGPCILKDFRQLLNPENQLEFLLFSQKIIKNHWNTIKILIRLFHNLPVDNPFENPTNTGRAIKVLKFIDSKCKYSCFPWKFELYGLYRMISLLNIVSLERSWMSWQVDLRQHQQILTSYAHCQYSKKRTRPRSINIFTFSFDI